VDDLEVEDTKLFTGPATARKSAWRLGAEAVINARQSSISEYNGTRLQVL